MVSNDKNILYIDYKENKIYSDEKMVAILVIMMYSISFGCIYKLLFGIPCPGCGMTRALLSLMKLDIHSAIKYHPLCILVVVLCLAYAFTLLEKKKGRQILNERIINYITTGLIIVFIFIYICRLIIHDPIVMPNIQNGIFFKTFKYIKNWR